MVGLLNLPPLPPWAVPDLAYQDTLEFGASVAIGSTITQDYAPGGELIVFPLQVETALTTSASAGTRRVSVLVLDSNDNQIATIPASQGQAASLTYHYSWSVALASAYFNGTANLAAPMPPLLVLPTMTLRVQVAGALGDNLQGATVTAIFIPPGQQEAQTPALAPTPLVA